MKPLKHKIATPMGATTLYMLKLLPETFQTFLPRCVCAWAGRDELRAGTGVRLSELNPRRVTEYNKILSP